MRPAALAGTSTARRRAAARRPTRNRRISAALLAAMIWASALAAQEEGSWTLRSQLTRILGDQRIHGASAAARERRKLVVSGGTGAAAEIEYRIRRHLGIGLRVDLARLDAHQPPTDFTFYDHVRHQVHPCSKTAPLA